MTEPQHPLTPPPELLKQLARSGGYHIAPSWLVDILTASYQAGADQELEACCRDLAEYCDCGVELTSGRVRELLMELRRPKPPSLAEQALALLQPGEPRLFNGEMQDTLRRALERLQQLEDQQ